MIHKPKTATEITVARIKHVSNKAEEKRAPQGPVTLCNEQQETIFNTPLSIAADTYTNVEKQLKLWKEKKPAAKKALCEEMKKANLIQITVGTEKVIRYKWSPAKEDIVLKDYKAKTPARNRYRR